MLALFRTLREPTEKKSDYLSIGPADSMLAAHFAPERKFGISVPEDSLGKDTLLIYQQEEQILNWSRYSWKLSENTTCHAIRQNQRTIPARCLQFLQLLIRFVAGLFCFLRWVW